MLLILIFITSTYLAHISMAKDFKEFDVKKVTFEYFLEEFNKIQWVERSGFPYNTYTTEVLALNLRTYEEYRRNYINAGIININGTRLQFGFIAHTKYLIWNLKN